MHEFDDLIPQAVSTAGAFDDLIPQNTANISQNRIPASNGSEPQSPFADLIPSRPQVKETIGPTPPISIKTFLPATSGLFDKIPSRLKASTFPLRLAWDVIQIPYRTIQTLEQLTEGRDVKSAIRLGFADAPLQDPMKQQIVDSIWNVALIYSGAKWLNAREFKLFLRKIQKAAEGAPRLESITFAVPKTNPEELRALLPAERKALKEAVITVNSKMGELPSTYDIASERLRGKGPGALKTAQELAMERLGGVGRGGTTPAPIVEPGASQLAKQASPRAMPAAQPSKTEGIGLARKPTRFAERVAASPQTAAEVKQDIQSFYSPISNKDVLNKAKARIISNPDEALAYAMDSELSAESAATAQLLIKKLQDEGRFNLAIDLIEQTSEKATNIGQALQALSMWSNLTPDGILRYATRIFERANIARRPRAVKSVSGFSNMSVSDLIKLAK